MSHKIEKNIQEYLGPQGVAVLKKALKQSDTDSDNWSEMVDSMQIMPRSVIAWAHNLVKNLTDSKEKFAGIPGTEYVISITKKDNKFDYQIVKKTETVIQESSVELPGVVMSLLKVTDSMNNIEKAVDSEELQKAINFLVEKFHFTKDKISVTISKSESSATCPDCNQKIQLSTDKNKLCICFKIFKNHLHVNKSEDGRLKVNFDGKWDRKNIFLLVSALKAKSDKY